MSFSSRSKTISGSFWLGTALNIVTVILAAIINAIIPTPILWLDLSFLILIGLAIFITGTKIFHVWVFIIGLFFGFFLVLVFVEILIIAGVTALAFIFGLH